MHCCSIAFEICLSILHRRPGFLVSARPRARATTAPPILCVCVRARVCVCVRPRDHGDANSVCVCVCVRARLCVCARASVTTATPILSSRGPGGRGSAAGGRRLQQRRRWAAAASGGESARSGERVRVHAGSRTLFSFVCVAAALAHAYASPLVTQAHARFPLSRLLPPYR